MVRQHQMLLELPLTEIWNKDLTGCGFTVLGYQELGRGVTTPHSQYRYVVGILSTIRNVYIALLFDSRVFNDSYSGLTHTGAQEVQRKSRACGKRSLVNFVRVCWFLDCTRIWAHMRMRNSNAGPEGALCTRSSIHQP